MVAFIYCWLQLQLACHYILQRISNFWIFVTRHHHGYILLPLRVKSLFQTMTRSLSFLSLWSPSSRKLLSTLITQPMASLCCGRQDLSTCVQVVPGEQSISLSLRTGERTKQSHLQPLTMIPPPPLKNNLYILKIRRVICFTGIASTAQQDNR